MAGSDKLVNDPLAEPLRAVLGDRTAKVLAKALEVRTVGDLLRHYPRRYAERGELTDLADLQFDEHVTVMAEVASLTSRRMRNRGGSLLEVKVRNGRDVLTLTFFNQQWRERDLKPGRVGLFAGKVGRYRGERQLIHPDYQLLGDESEGSEAVAFASALIPVYSATAALPSWKIAQCIRVVLDTLPEVADPLPEQLRQRRGLVDLRTAFVTLHQPGSQGDIRQAQERLKWDEAFVLHVILAMRRRAAVALSAAPRRPKPDGLLAAFDNRLPFTLTAGQREVGQVIAADLARDHPMHRLLQGEVGSGKTVIALRAMLTVLDAGGQAALLVPTEVLAQQHHRSLTALLGPLAERGLLGGAEIATRVALLTGSLGTAARRQALADAACGQAGIVIGTHALIEEAVQFYDLGLVVIDEQHRFGVEQRNALRSKAAKPPHLLVMTATPIPRTVAMTVFGDLEVSTLTELPAGRAPIATHLAPTVEKPSYLHRAWQRVVEEVAAGRQAYVVCPRIGDAEGSEQDTGDEPALDDLPAEAGAAPRRPPLAVLDIVPMLAEGPLRGLRIEALHGQLSPDAKDETMRRFTAGEVDVLVATTVIEVGVDVPNATVMVVLDADRFGVSQLHQLRGRVGRGDAAGLCLLVTEVEANSPARQRLEAVATTLDAFELSRIDLEQRREGDVLGASQSGRLSSLRMLAVIRDEEIIQAAREEATALVATDPELSGYPTLAAIVAGHLDTQRVQYLEKT